MRTTDFLLDLERGGWSLTLARAIKPSEALNDPRTIEKLEIERRYWMARGADWGIVTERDLPPTLLDNLKFLQGCASLEDLEQPWPGFYQQQATLVAEELEGSHHLTLREFCLVTDEGLTLTSGATLLLVKHLLATKVSRTDMSQPITETTLLPTFWRDAASTARRIRP